MSDDPMTIKWYAGVSIIDREMAARLKNMVAVPGDGYVGGPIPTTAPKASSRNPFEPEQLRPSPGEPGMQVWCGRELIGWFKVSAAQMRQGAVEIPIWEMPMTPAAISPDDPLPMPTMRSHRFAIEKRSVRVDNFELARARDVDGLKEQLQKTHRIPSDAEVIQEPHMDAMFYRWRVIKVTIDQSEEIFDLDGFVPNPDQR